MTRLWTVPGVVGVATAVVTAWLVRAVVAWAAGTGGAPVRAATLGLVYAAGPALLCAVPVALVARAVLGARRRGDEPRLSTARAPRTAPTPQAATHPGIARYVLVGLVGGVLVGVAQPLVLLSAWPWQLAGPVAWELVGVPAVAGLAGGVAAGSVAGARGAGPVVAGRGR